MYRGIMSSSSTHLSQLPQDNVRVQNIRDALQSTLRRPGEHIMDVVHVVCLLKEIYLVTGKHYAFWCKGSQPICSTALLDQPFDTLVTHPTTNEVTQLGCLLSIPDIRMINCTGDLRMLAVALCCKPAKDVVATRLRILRRFQELWTFLGVDHVKPGNGYVV